MNSKKVTEFADIITNTDLLAYLASVFISVPTPIQVDCIPKLMGPGHFTVQSHTGTGKTLGYLLPLVSQLKASESKDDVRINGSPRAVIVAPTRELAAQIFSVVKEISHHAKLRVRKLVGGDKGKSLKSMFSMPMDILVTTPDRCLRSLKNKELSKASLKYLILDEADHLLEPSFKSIMQQMAFELQDTDFQLFLVSATRPAQFTETIQSFFPALTLQAIDATQGNTAEMRIDIFNLAVEEKEKFLYVKDFLRQQKHRNGVIFTGSKLRAQRLAEELLAAGQKDMFLLHKDLEIKDRAEVIANFRKKGGVLIATDIFARGIDIPHLQWVLNFDLPSEPYYYLHRNGRVGRLDREGNVYNFITSKDAERIERINKALVTQGRTDLKIDATARKKMSFKRK
ncbi:MAG: DEAD/DEAH box helicase [Candidatus Sericytochromatia bacterium]|nr:DEAD/DEAH box helicase [Candidatus Sericytochromatia bacterium]